MIFGIKEKNDHFDPYSVLLAIATNIPMLLVNGFVIQGINVQSDICCFQL